MSEYIKREDVLQVIAGLLNVTEQIDSADVVEVVRCKDCVKRHNGCPMQVWCGPEDDDFCSRGVMKDDE